ncbi:MAG: DUF87 domain-containing protein [Nanoarchaeota archaeon]
MKNKIIFIFLISFIIFLVASVQNVSAQTYTVSTTTCSGKLFIPAGTTIINIKSGVTVSTEYLGDTPGECIIDAPNAELNLQGGNLEGNFKIYVNKLSLSYNSKIDASGKGYKGGVARIDGCGAENCCSTARACGGSGFVNDGGNGCWHCTSDVDIFPGSKGGIQNYCSYGRGGGEPRRLSSCSLYLNQPSGGNGGGKIEISASEVNIDLGCSILANGGNGGKEGYHVAGGGSGGKISIATSKLAISGFISVKGGNGQYDSGFDGVCSGGGSGGFVIINYIESSKSNDTIKSLIDVSGGRAGYVNSNCKDGGLGQKEVNQNTYTLSLTLDNNPLDLKSGVGKSVILRTNLIATMINKLTDVELEYIVEEKCRNLNFEISGLETFNLEDRELSGTQQFPLTVKFTGSLSGITNPQCTITFKAKKSGVDIPGASVVLNVNLIPQIDFSFSPNPYPDQYVLTDSEARLPGITITNNGEMAFDFNFSGGRSFLDYNYNKITVSNNGGKKTLEITSKNLSSGNNLINIKILPCFFGTSVCYSTYEKTVSFTLRVLDLNLTLTPLPPYEEYDKNNPQPINIETKAYLGTVDKTSNITNFSNILIIDKAGNEESCFYGQDLTYKSSPIIKCYPYLGEKSRNLEDGRKYDARIKLTYNADGTILDLEKVVREVIKYKDITPPIIDPFLDTGDWQKQDNLIKFIEITVTTRDVTGTTSGSGQLTFPNGTSIPVSFNHDTYYDTDQAKFVDVWQSEELSTTLVDKDKKHKLVFSAVDENSNSAERTFEFTFADKIKFSGSIKDVDYLEKGKIASFDINSLIQGKSFSFASTPPNGDYSKDIDSGEYNVIIKNTENPELSGDSVAYHDVLFDQDITGFITAFGESPAISQELPVDIEPIKVKTLAVISNNNQLYPKTISFNYRNLVENLKVDINNLMILHCPSWDFENKICVDSDWIGYDQESGMILNETIYTASVDFDKDEKIGAFALTEVCPGCFGLDNETGEGLTEKGIYETDEFRIETTLMTATLHPGENREYTLKFINKITENIKFKISDDGGVAEFIDFEKKEINLAGFGTEIVKIFVKIPSNVEIKTYVGNMVIDAVNEAINLNKKVKFPVTLNIEELTEEDQLLNANVQFLTITQDGGILLTTQLINLGKMTKIEALIDYTVRNYKGEVVAQDSDFAEFYSTSSTQKTIQPLSLLTKGKYLIEAVVIYDGDKLTDAIDTFEIKKNIFQVALDFLKTRKFLGIKLTYYALFLILAGLTTSGIIYYRKLMEKKRKEALKYKVDIDYNLLPKPGLRSAIIGKIAESDKKAYVNLESLKLHTIVSGSTGSGKTICAQAICEGALMRGTHVIVFDPSAQWTGFLKKCQEPKMLNQYAEFGLTNNAARSFSGKIEMIEDPREKINVRDLLREKNKEGKEGSITIYCLNKLEPDAMDLFIANTVREIFALQPTESDKLKVLLVYDEVHRLLEKFGGKGKGFVQIERGIREFRKWGIGMVLISQVSSDFIGEIKANISTEIQMRTRYENDLNRIKDNFGEKISGALVRAPVGTGMFVNAEYNKGRPYFMVVRPILHATKRLSDEELKRYNYYSNKVEDIRYQLDVLRQYNIDLRGSILNYEDLEYNYKKACDILISGDFVKLEAVLNNIDSALQPIIAKYPNISMTRPKLIKEEVIEKSINEANVERAKYVEVEKPYNEILKNYKEVKKKLGENKIVLELRSELIRIEQLIKNLRFNWDDKKAGLIKQRINLLNQVMKKYL